MDATVDHIMTSKWYNLLIFTKVSNYRFSVCHKNNFVKASLLVTRFNVRNSIRRYFVF